MRFAIGNYIQLSSQGSKQTTFFHLAFWDAYHVFNRELYASFRPQTNQNNGNYHPWIKNCCPLKCTHFKKSMTEKLPALNMTIWLVVAGASDRKWLQDLSLLRKPSTEKCSKILLESNLVRIKGRAIAISWNHKFNPNTSVELYFFPWKKFLIGISVGNYLNLKDKRSADSPIAFSSLHVLGLKVPYGMKPVLMCCSLEKILDWKWTTIYKHGLNKREMR